MSGELQRTDSGMTKFIKSLTMTSTDRANEANRGVIEYEPCDVGAFYKLGTGLKNCIVSGGSNQYRVSALVRYAENAINNNLPTIILHEGNKELENQMRYAFSSTGKYIEINENNPCFEPFYKLNAMEITNQIFEAAPKEYDIKYSARYYIEGISEILTKKGKNLSFNMFSTCPHHLIFDKVDELRMNGIISDAEEQSIKSKLMMGQGENFKLDTYFSGFKLENDLILYGKNRMSRRPVNIISAINNKNVVCIDVSSSANKLLINILISQLKLSLTKNFKYLLLIDSISINANEKYADYIKGITGKVNYMFSSEDFYSMTGGDDKIFSTLVGNSHINIVMSHSSANTAQKWSEVFGMYDKYETSYSKTRGSTRRTPFSILSSPNVQSTVSVNEKREYIVKPEQIARMGVGEAYIAVSFIDEIAHLILKS